ncbi:hypothetical protein FEF65_00075 [Mariprofundus erugo]|uniref:Histidine kinase n=2 Tax=Mariprofundus erugo TaxID=2528639 RepID=A0A5R9GRR9_9PROT|nr:hypothetical protein FEF65_00075 [Mariprofundus erugo]
MFVVRRSRMKTAQLSWSEQSGWSLPPDPLPDAGLVMVFSNDPYFRSESCFSGLRALFPEAHIVGCSSAGSVQGVEISDDGVVATAIKLERSSLRIAAVDVDAGVSACDIGEKLIAGLAAPDLRHVFVLSDGMRVNGSDLARGLNKAGVAVTGGLAGDGERFQSTWVMADAPAREGVIVAVGFYGPITVSSGCFAGWVEFGTDRIVTRSEGNVVYEIDDQPALQLYKRYLGEQADGLPYSGLRFPLSIQASKDDLPLTRTLLAVDEEANSLTFAGDVPQGYVCKLMQANLDSLIDSAGQAAESAMPDQTSRDGLCLLVSCVGRRLVMGQLIEEELDIVRERLGEGMAMTGFYSYGELAPFSGLMQCQLHNQTMTLTTLYE